MKTSGIKTVIHIAAVLAMILLIIISSVSGGAYIARAAVAAPEEFESRGVLEDLQGMTVDGEPFSITDYPANADGTPQLITLAEYCYAYYADMQGYYGIYIYVYNPAQTNYDFTSGKCKVEMHVGGNGNYKKYKLKLLSTTTQAGYDNRFYKLKVELTAAERTAILKALDSTERIYELSGLELLNKSLPEFPNATEYAVGGKDKDGKAYGRKYTYTGYAEGYDVSGANKSTLACTQSGVEVIEIEVQSTYYFYPNDLHTATQLNSVYFSLDNELIEKYGKLYSILAEYWQYELPPIAVVNDEDLYGYLRNAPADIAAVEEESKYQLFGYKDEHFTIVGGEYVYPCEWRYGNPFVPSFTFSEINGCERYTKKLITFKRDDPRNVTISRDDITAALLDLSEETGAPEGEYNEWLFRGGKGYMPVYIEADDLFDLKGFDTGNALNNWWLNITHQSPNNPTIEDIKPIYQITKTDLERDNWANYLLIAQEDEEAFKAYCREEVEKGKTVYLFRYGISEYKELPMEAIQNNFWNTKVRNQSVRFQTVDLDFDIIQLGFGNRTAQVFIPVVSSPMDLYASSPSMNEIIDGAKKAEWWRYAIGIGAALTAVLIIDIIVEKTVKRGSGI